MPIPDFDHNDVIPPHLGDPRYRSHVSPYIVSSYEFVQRFATSQSRIEILKGFLKFRSALGRHGIDKGYQWVDGSFTENVEKSQGRPPADLDLVTLFWAIDMDHLSRIEHGFPSFMDSRDSKRLYKLDHYFIDLNQSHYPDPSGLVETVTYWFQLFCHNRKRVWKGLIRIPLDTPEDDTLAAEYLNNLNKT